MLSKEENEIYTYGLDKIEDYQNVKKCNDLTECIERSYNIITAIPMSKDKTFINSPYTDEKIKITDFANKLNNKRVIAGSILEDFEKSLNGKNVEVIDILKKEELSILNSIATAEGAIKIAIEETQITLHDCNVLVLGFGRIGKVLAKTLHLGFNANVYCEARKKEDLAWIKTYGYKPIPINELNENLNKFDMIFNTIPFIILDESKLKKLKKECIVIDLASYPGGVDNKVAEDLKIKVISALGIPGKVAPITSAKYIKNIIEDIVN